MFTSQLDLALTGILAGISDVLAKAGIPIFAISTYNTDYILVKTDKLKNAIAALKGSGYLFITRSSRITRVSLFLISPPP